MASAIAYLDRLIAITVIHSPPMPAKKANDLDELGRWNTDRMGNDRAELPNHADNEVAKRAPPRHDRRINRRSREPRIV